MRTNGTLLVSLIAASLLAACEAEPAGGSPTAPPAAKTETAPAKPTGTTTAAAKTETPKAADAKPGDTKPGETKTAEAQPGETRPAAAPPADAKPGETKPADAAGTAGGEPAVAAVRAFIAQRQIDTSKDGWKTKLPKPPQVTFDAGKSYYWNLATSEGPIRIKLFPDVAPMHVTSTIYLTELGFYDGLAFHRVIPGFMAQGGDPLGTGMGGPGYKYAGEYSPQARHTKAGILSMANSGANSDGSQFFLTFKATPHLDRGANPNYEGHTVFGEIVGDEGLATLKKLEAAGSMSGQTSKPLSITKATIVVE